MDTQTKQTEEQEVSTLLDNHLNQVVLDTIIENLNSEQLLQFQAALDDPNNLDEQITSITSSIPGLQAKIELAVQRELEVINTARENIS